MTIVCLQLDSRGGIVPPMQADALTLAKLLTAAALLGATIEYIKVIKRRVVRRAASRERAVMEERSLEGLVRVFLADGAPTATAPMTTEP